MKVKERIELVKFLHNFNDLPYGDLDIALQILEHPNLYPEVCKFFKLYKQELEPRLQDLPPSLCIEVDSVCVDENCVWFSVKPDNDWQLSLSYQATLPRLIGFLQQLPKGTCFRNFHDRWVTYLKKKN